MKKKLAEKIISLFEARPIPYNASWFIVNVEKDGSEATIKISKSLRKWKEQVLKDEDNIVKTVGYQNYLKPNDIMGWLKKDFDMVEVEDFDDVEDDEEEDDIEEKKITEASREERDFANFIEQAINFFDESDEGGNIIKNIKGFKEAGVLSSETGLVIDSKKGKFQLTIVKE